MPGDNANKAKQKLERGNRRHQMRADATGMSRYESECEGFLPPEQREKLHNLFGQIEKEFESLYAENQALSERIEVLERLESEKALTDSLDAPDLGASKPKRATQISQKIKTTYKASTSKIVSSFRNPSPNYSVVRSYRGHRDGVWEVSVSRSSQPVLGTASADNTARIWCIGTNQCLLQYIGHQGSVNSIRFHPNQELALTGSGDQTAHIWGAHVSPLSQNVVRSHSSGEDDIDGSEKEDVVDDVCDQIQEVSTLRTPTMELSGHIGVIVAADWMAEGSQVITASWDRSAILFDAETGEQIITLTGHDQELTDVRAHPTQRLAVTSSKDTTFRLFDMRDPNLLVNVFQGHSQPVTSAVFAGSENVVSGSDDRTVKVWDLKNMRSPIATIRTDSSVNRLAVSGSHNCIAIPHDNRHIRLYDIHGNRIGRLPRSNRQGHSKMVTSVCWSETENTVCNLFSCGFDRQVLGWTINFQSKE